MSTGPLGPEVGNPFPKPPTSSAFAIFPGDYQDSDGARLLGNSLTKSKYHEYMTIKAVCSHLYDVVVRQFECIHNVSLSHSVCKVLAESTLSIVK